MILQTWGQVLQSSFQGLWAGVIMFIPNLIVAIIIVLIGWGIGVIVCNAIEQFIRAIKFDHALRKAGFEMVVQKAGLTLNSGKFIGKIIEYFIVIVFLIAAFNV